MAESTAPERLTRKTTSIAQLLARRVLDTPDREAYRYPVGDQWRSMTWRQAGERIKAIAAGLLSLGLDRIGAVRPALVQETDPLGLAGRAGGVDQRGEVLAPGGRDDIVDRARILGQVRGARGL